MPLLRASDGQLNSRVVLTPVPHELCCRYPTQNREQTRAAILPVLIVSITDTCLVLTNPISSSLSNLQSVCTITVSIHGWRSWLREEINFLRWLSRHIAEAGFDSKNSDLVEFLASAWLLCRAIGNPMKNTNTELPLRFPLWIKP